MKIGKKVLFVVGLLVIFAGFSLTPKIAIAEKVVDEQGNYIELSDKDGSFSQGIQGNSIYSIDDDNLLQTIQNTNFNGKRDIPKLHYRFPGINTAQDIYDRFPTISHQNIQNILSETPSEKANAFRIHLFDFNSTPYESFWINSIPYKTILHSKNITVYNETGKNSINDDLRYTFDQWEKVYPVHFNLVNDPNNAEIVVTSNSTQTKRLENGFDGLFTIISTYDSYLVKGEVTISPELASKNGYDRSRRHTIMHEFGHILGLPDLG